MSALDVCLGILLLLVALFTVFRLLFLVLAVVFRAIRARRSPVSKAHLQVAGAVVLTVAGVIGAVNLIRFLFSGDRSSSAPAIVLLVAFILAAFVGLLVFILRVTDGYFAKLPEGVARVSVHRRKTYPKFKAVAIVLALIVGFGLFFGWMYAAIFGGLFLALAFPFLLGLYLKAGRFDHGLALLMANPWVHWPALPGAAAAYFGPDGFLCGDEYLPWVLSGSYLGEAAVSADPPARLLLSFNTYRPTIWGTSWVRVEKSVPLPGGVDGDLDVLQEQLQRRCPKASINVRIESTLTEPRPEGVVLAKPHAPNV